MNAQIKITYRDKDNNIIENPEDGQMSYSPETQKLYQFIKGEWKMIDNNSVGLNMNIYDMNKQVVSQLPSMKNEDVDKAMILIEQYLKAQQNEFYMLLCRDINYYTVIYLDDTASDVKAPAEILACASEVGELKSVDLNGNDAIEVWVKPEDSDALVMYLFPYDRGVVSCSL